MKSKFAFAAIVALLIWLLPATAFCKSILDRAGQENWYAWYDEQGKRNGYSEERFEKITVQGKPGVRTTSKVVLKAKGKTTTVDLTLTSTEMEPMVDYCLTVSDEMDGKKETTVLTGKPEGALYLFKVTRPEGTKQTIPVERSVFDYFDFEDHYFFFDLVPGKKREYKILNTFTLGVEVRGFENLGDEKKKIKKQKTDCMKIGVTSKDYGAKILIRKSDGVIISQDFTNKTRIEWTDKEKALSWKESK